MKKVKCSKVKDIIRLRNYVNSLIKEGYTDIPVKCYLHNVTTNFKVSDFGTGSMLCNYLHENIKNDEAILAISNIGCKTFPMVSIYEL